MPQESRYRRRSRSHSRGKNSRRRRHGSSKSSGSSYSRSRSRSVEKRYHDKRSSRRTPPKYRHSSKHSSHERKRRSYNDRSRSRSVSSSPRQRRSHKKEAPAIYPLETAKVLSGNFSEIPGLDFIGRGSEKAKKSSQDLDMRLRELETQHSSGAPRSRSVVEQPKNVQRGYYESKGAPQQEYQQRSKSPVEQKYERGMSPNGRRYREQQRPDYGLRVEVQRKENSPKDRKLDPSLVVIPRRKDEGLRPIFDRPEIIVRILEDDPELYPEKYERFACWQKSPEPEQSNRKDDQMFIREKDERPRKHGRHHKGKQRSLSPDPSLPETMVMMKPFTVFEKYEQSLRSRPGVLQDLDDQQYPLHHSQDFPLSQTSNPLGASTSSFTTSLPMDSMLNVGSDLRQDLDIRRHLLTDATSPSSRLTSSGFPADRREIFSDRRPVRERLGDIDGGGLLMDSSIPDFKKEVEELQRLDPMSPPYRGQFFQHDDRDKRSASLEKREERPPQRGHFVPRGPFRGTRGGFYRGSNYRGNNFRPGYTRGYRGSFRGRGFGRGAYRGFSSYTPSWKHDKFEEKDKDRREKRDKKEKKSKSTDKKKSKKSSKRTPERSKYKKNSK